MEQLSTCLGRGVAAVPSAHPAGLMAGLESAPHRQGARQLTPHGQPLPGTRCLAAVRQQQPRHPDKANLQQQFEQYLGSADVLRHELLKRQGIWVSLRSVDRAVQAWREALRQGCQATIRYEGIGCMA